MARQAFYSFHYDNDHWRAAQVRNIGIIEGNRPAPDNDWESIKKGGEAAIQKWIDDQIRYRSCTIVLVGSATARRKWIDYEIRKSWNEKMGLVGISIHGLKDRFGNQSIQGANPFSHFTLNNSSLSNVVRTYTPPYYDSKDIYNYISNNISIWVAEAVKIRSQFS